MGDPAGAGKVHDAGGAGWGQSGTQRQQGRENVSWSFHTLHWCWKSGDGPVGDPAGAWKVDDAWRKRGGGMRMHPCWRQLEARRMFLGAVEGARGCSVYDTKFRHWRWKSGGGPREGPCWRWEVHGAGKRGWPQRGTLLASTGTRCFVLGLGHWHWGKCAWFGCFILVQRCWGSGAASERSRAGAVLVMAHVCALVLGKVGVAQRGPRWRWRKCTAQGRRGGVALWEHPWPLAPTGARLLLGAAGGASP